LTLPQAAAPPDPPFAPAERAPEGACDAHFHMLGDDFPLWSGRVEDPAPGAMTDWAARYRRLMATLGLSRGVVVHSILYGDDNRLTAAAIEALGRENFRGVGLVRDGAPEAALDRLLEQGMAGVRINLVHGGVLSLDGAARLAPAMAERGLHLQMLVNAERNMADAAEAARRLQVPVVFDHLAWADVAAGVDAPGFSELLRLVGEGRAWVKLSGVYRLCGGDWAAADAHVAALLAANPERCLWGTDWPHIMLGPAEQPDPGALLDAFHRVATAAETRRRVLVDNPAALYRFA
jgi:predicted TIM-barrel fold metal-dependent hydrolase